MGSHLSVKALTVEKEENDSHKTSNIKVAVTPPSSDMVSNPLISYIYYIFLFVTIIVEVVQLVKLL